VGGSNCNDRVAECALDSLDNDTHGWRDYITVCEREIRRKPLARLSLAGSLMNEFSVGVKRCMGRAEF